MKSSPLFPILSPRQLGEALGISESSLKRWANEGRLEFTRTAGGHRRIPLHAAVQFIRESGLPVVKPQMLGLADLKHPLTAPHNCETANLLQAALAAGRATEARAIILAHYLDGQDVAALCDGPIRSAMRAIGELWNNEEEGIFIEHRATDICLQALAQVRGLIGQPPPDAPVAIGGGPSCDPYALPSLMAAITLASARWQTVNLGPDTPAEVLAQAATAHGARIVWLSVTIPQKPAAISAAVDSLARELRTTRAALVIGGQGLPARFHPTADNTCVVGSMAELAAFARGLRD